MTHVATVAIQASQIEADLGDFLCELDLSLLGAPFWDTVANGGGDIRVFKSGGVTELPRYPVACDTSSDEGVLLFQYTGTTSSTIDTLVEIHADGTSPDYLPTATYGRENVYSNGGSGNFYQAALECHDLTTEGAYSYAVSTVGTVSLVAGRVGGHNAVQTDVGVSGIRTQKLAGDINGTLRAWAKTSVNGLLNTYASIADASEPDEQMSLRKNTSDLQQMVYAEGGAFSFTNGSLVSGDWTLFHVNIASNGVDKELFANDVSDVSSIISWNPVGVDRLAVGITADSTPLGSAGSIVSGARFRIGMMSDAEVAAEWSNGNDPANFFDITNISPGSEVTVEDGAVVAQAAETSGSLSRTVSVTSTPLSVGSATVLGTIEIENVIVQPDVDAQEASVSATMIIERKIVDGVVTAGAATISAVVFVVDGEVDVTDGAVVAGSGAVAVAISIERTVVDGAVVAGSAQVSGAITKEIFVVDGDVDAGNADVSATIGDGSWTPDAYMHGNVYGEGALGVAT